MQLPKCIREGTKSFVIDAEAVAWDKETERLLPFQELSRRKRKDVKAEDIKVKVHLFAFDLLYLNGKPLLAENLERRRELLRESLQPVEGEFAFATSDDATNVDDIQIFLDKSIKDGCEGLMVKMLEGEGASYEPSRRSIHWLKVRFLCALLGGWLADLLSTQNSSRRTTSPASETRYALSQASSSYAR